ncbi:hypothetical protein CHLRE_09g398051v5 [Chlamydomonas reinhardtii]|uniref:Guanylate cyclase domain-containing protein n=1 Tax=Chlamydomonas reinhardtii TaxID=3055 RepID=A0A2K3DD13_CHLRE|nr:uncharacterized protein CHLRE_09g398051v5 [Chlamydomonas reinhardtii]PNW78425.1 hypothetical protein CHLRE_09g398051v5 [Chlamydomonas reinhardtii]
MASAVLLLLDSVHGSGGSRVCILDNIPPAVRAPAHLLRSQRDLLSSARRRALAASLQPHYTAPQPGPLGKALRAPAKRRFWALVKDKLTLGRGGGSSGSSSGGAGEHLVLWAPSLHDPRFMPFLSTPLRQALLGGADGAEGDGDMVLYRGMVHPDVPGLALMGLEAHAGSSLLLLELQAQWLAAHLAGRLALPPAAAMRADVAAQRVWRSGALAHPLMSVGGSLARRHEQYYLEQLRQDLKATMSDHESSAPQGAGRHDRTQAAEDRSSSIQRLPAAASSIRRGPQRRITPSRLSLTLERPPVTASSDAAPDTAAAAAVDDASASSRGTRRPLARRLSQLYFAAATAAAAGVASATGKQPLSAAPASTAGLSCTSHISAARDGAGVAQSGQRASGHAGSKATSARSLSSAAALTTAAAAADSGPAGYLVVRGPGVGSGGGGDAAGLQRTASSASTRTSRAGAADALLPFRVGIAGFGRQGSSSAGSAAGATGMAAAAAAVLGTSRRYGSSSWALPQHAYGESGAATRALHACQLAAWTAASAPPSPQFLPRVSHEAPRNNTGLIDSPSMKELSPQQGGSRRAAAAADITALPAAATHAARVWNRHSYDPALAYAAASPTDPATGSSTAVSATGPLAGTVEAASLPLAQRDGGMAMQSAGGARWAQSALSSNTMPLAGATSPLVGSGQGSRQKSQTIAGDGSYQQPPPAAALAAQQRQSFTRYEAAAVGYAGGLASAGSGTSQISSNSALGLSTYRGSGGSAAGAARPPQALHAAHSCASPPLMPSTTALHSAAVAARMHNQGSAALAGRRLPDASDRVSAPDLAAAATASAAASRRALYLGGSRGGSGTAAFMYSYNPQLQQQAQQTQPSSQRFSSAATGNGQSSPGATTGGMAQRQRGLSGQASLSGGALASPLSSGLMGAHGRIASGRGGNMSPLASSVGGGAVPAPPATAAVVSSGCAPESLPLQLQLRLAAAAAGLPPAVPTAASGAAAVDRVGVFTSAAATAFGDGGGAIGSATSTPTSASALSSGARGLALLGLTPLATVASVSALAAVVGSAGGPTGSGASRRRLRGCSASPVSLAAASPRSASGGVGGSSMHRGGGGGGGEVSGGQFASNPHESFMAMIEEASAPLRAMALASGLDLRTLMEVTGTGVAGGNGGIADSRGGGNSNVGKSNTTFTGSAAAAAVAATAVMAPALAPSLSATWTAFERRSSVLSGTSYMIIGDGNEDERRSEGCHGAGFRARTTASASAAPPRNSAGGGRDVGALHQSAKSGGLRSAGARSSTASAAAYGGAGGFSSSGACRTPSGTGGGSGGSGSSSGFIGGSTSREGFSWRFVPSHSVPSSPRHSLALPTLLEHQDDSSELPEAPLTFWTSSCTTTVSPDGVPAGAAAEAPRHGGRAAAEQQALATIHSQVAGPPAHSPQPAHQQQGQAQPPQRGQHHHYSFMHAGGSAAAAALQHLMQPRRPQAMPPPALMPRSDAGTAPAILSGMHGDLPRGGANNGSNGDDSNDTFAAAMRQHARVATASGRPAAAAGALLQPAPSRLYSDFGPARTVGDNSSSSFGAGGGISNLGAESVVCWEAFREQAKTSLAAPGAGSGEVTLRTAAGVSKHDDAKVGRGKTAAEGDKRKGKARRGGW